MLFNNQLKMINKNRLFKQNKNIKVYKKGIQQLKKVQR